MRNGASIPPAPVRESELVISLAKSSIVVLAHDAWIVVPGTTGFPAGSEYVPDALRGISIAP